MEKLNELLEKQIEHLNYNRNELIDAITEAEENTLNYPAKVREIRDQIVQTDMRIDELMSRMTFTYQITEDGSKIKTS